MQRNAAGLEAPLVLRFAALYSRAMTMSRWSVAGLVVVLSAAGSVLAQPLPEPDGRWVVASTRTKASLSPDGPWLAQAIRFGFGLEVQRDSGPRLPIRTKMSGVRLVLYVDRSTLQTVVIDDAELVPTVAAAAHALEYNSPGMVLNAGTVIEVIALAENGLSKVRIHGHQRGKLRITGFVASSKIGTLYRQHGMLSHFEFGEVSLPGNFKLLDAPGGAAFAISTKRERVPAKTIERNGKFTLVRIAEGAVGWIASSQVREVPESKREFIGDMFAQPVGTECEERGEGVPNAAGGCTPDPKNAVREKTPLFDAIDGSVVGTVTSYFRYQPVQQDRGWARFEVPTRFGKVPLWAHLDEAALALARRAADHAGDTDANPPGGMVETEVSFEGGVAVPPPPPPPPLRPPPRNVAPGILEANRIGGDREIPPDEATRAEMAQARKEKLVGSYKLCVDVTGGVSSVTQLKFTGFPAYDRALNARIRSWSFRPILTDGKPEPVCTVTTFSYQQPLPAP